MEIKQKSVKLITEHNNTRLFVIHRSPNPWRVSVYNETFVKWNKHLGIGCKPIYTVNPEQSPQNVGNLLHTK